MAGTAHVAYVPKKWYKPINKKRPEQLDINWKNVWYSFWRFIFNEY
jgi:hypothetical protein